jgi:hypothetical protein
MSSVVEIEHAIRQLPPEDLARFRDWFTEFDAQRWDRQIEDGAAAGPLDALAEEAIEDFREQ